MQPRSSEPAETPSFDIAKYQKHIRWGAIILGILAVGVLAFFIIREIRREKAKARWDELAKIITRHEAMDLRTNPVVMSADSEMRTRLDRYIQDLEGFLVKYQDGTGDALVPYAHFLLAMASRDGAMAANDPADGPRRQEHLKRSIEHASILRDRYPDFQANWDMYSPRGEASLTRMFLANTEADLTWEKQFQLRTREPAAHPIVVIRTQRGDLRVKLFTEEAPELTRLFLDRALRGDYDGTAFFAKDDEEQDGKVVASSVRAGHPDTRGVRSFDRNQHESFERLENHPILIPEKSRYLMPITRGLLVAWHDLADEHDGAATFSAVTDRSLTMDFRYTPFGVLIDDASLETLDRIYDGETWATDVQPGRPARPGATDRFLRAPVVITKVLVFGDDGALLAPAEGDGPHRQAAGEKERRLEDLEPDAYLEAAPEQPAPPADDPEAPEAPAAPEKEGTDGGDGPPAPADDPDAPKGD